MPAQRTLGFRLALVALLFIPLASVDRSSSTRAAAPFAFEIPPPIPSGAPFIHDLEALDLDGDGHLDLVAVTSGGGEGISLLHGLGDGRFDLAVLQATLPGPRQVAAGDLDGDGRLDLVVATLDPQDLQQGGVVTLMGQGAGGFSPPRFEAVSPAPRDLLIRDFDEDGRPDLVLTQHFRTGVSLRHGDGTGGFGDSLHYDTGVLSSRLTAALLNRDAHVDLLVASPDALNLTSGRFSVLLGKGRAGFHGAAVMPVLGTVQTVSAADLDGDRNPEAIALSALERGAGVSSLLSIHRGSGSARLATGESIGAGFSAQDLLVGDLDDDGLTDAAATGFVGVFLIRGLGDGTFDRWNFVDLDVVTGRLAAGDFDEAGRLDLAIAERGGAVQLLLGR